MTGSKSRVPRKENVVPKIFSEELSGLLVSRRDRPNDATMRMVTVQAEGILALQAE